MKNDEYVNYSVSSLWSIQVIIAFFHEVFYESFVAMDRYEPLFTQAFVPVNRGGGDDRPCRR